MRSQQKMSRKKFRSCFSRKLILSTLSSVSKTLICIWNGNVLARPKHVGQQYLLLLLLKRKRSSIKLCASPLYSRFSYHHHHHHHHQCVDGRVPPHSLCHCIKLSFSLRLRSLFYSPHVKVGLAFTSSFPHFLYTCLTFTFTNSVVRCFCSNNASSHSNTWI